MKNIGRNKRAFTLIEVLVSCSILVILISAVVGLGTTIINGSRISRERIVAYYLSQEGIETIRQIRDSNLVDSDENTRWNTLVYSIGTPESASGYDQVVADGSKLYNIDLLGPKGRSFLTPTGSGEKVTIDGVEYLRKITFSQSGISVPQLDTAEKLADNAVVASVKVSWKHNSQTLEIETKELITNWKQQL